MPDKPTEQTFSQLLKERQEGRLKDREQTAPAVVARASVLPFVIEVLDQRTSAPIPGIAIHFEPATAGEGQSFQTTDEAGRVTAMWPLGSRSGYRMTVVVASSAAAVARGQTRAEMEAFAQLKATDAENAREAAEKAENEAVAASSTADAAQGKDADELRKVADELRRNAAQKRAEAAIATRNAREAKEQLDALPV